MRRSFLTFFACLLLAAGVAYAAMLEVRPKSRTFEFDYEVLVKNIPPRTNEVTIWLPHLNQRPYQQLEDVAFEPEGFARITYDPLYHNKILYYRISSPPESVKINVHYKVKRYEYSHKLSKSTQPPSSQDSDLKKYLVPNKLVTISGRIQTLAAAITREKKTTLQKARAIYDYVFENVRHDKTIPGWGRGDTERVCLVKAGNCTDFHSLFISLARAVGIPAKFVMGASIPQKPEGQIQGYHCWAEFYDKDLGWVPVDISEAWKDKSKRQYYFGTISEDRLEFSEGRDIVLEPSTHGEPLNYFLYPYVEVDGENFENLDVSFRFKDTTSKERG